MGNKPRILWIDDVYGRTQNGCNEDRDDLCSRLGLRNITERTDITQEGQDENKVVADVIFCRGQVKESNKVENDLDGTLKVVRDGWEKPPRWALLLLDMHFKTGPIDEDGEPTGRAEDLNPEQYFGLTILDSLWNKSQRDSRFWRDLQPRDIPVVITSVMEREEIEKRFASRGVYAFVDKIDLDEGKLRELLEEYGLLEDDQIIGRSVPLLKCLRDARRRARIPNDNILILGKSGTGKELLADYIHRQSDQKGKFVPCFLQGVPETLIDDRLFGHQKRAFDGAIADQPGAAESADNGTLFIDEFADIPATVQAKLLRLLDRNIRETQRLGEQKVRELQNLQVIMATEREEILFGTDFREALLARVRIHNAIRMPSLSERSEDIPLLVEHFVKKFKKEFHAEKRKVSEGALEALRVYPWPGNVRELESVIEYAVFTYKDLGILAVSHLGSLSHEIQSQPIQSELPSTQTKTDSTDETHSDNSTDGLIRYLNNLNFKGCSHDDLYGKLPKIEQAYAELLVRYLEVAFKLKDKKKQPAIRYITGKEVKNSIPARVIKNILKPRLTFNDPEVIKSLEKFVKEDTTLEEVYNKIVENSTQKADVDEDI